MYHSAHVPGSLSGARAPLQFTHCRHSGWSSAWGKSTVYYKFHQWGARPVARYFVQGGLILTKSKHSGGYRKPPTWVGGGVRGAIFAWKMLNFVGCIMCFDGKLQILYSILLYLTANDLKLTIYFGNNYCSHSTDLMVFWLLGFILFLKHSTLTKMGPLLANFINKTAYLQKVM